MALPPLEVQRLGQSIWTDNISRHLIQSGELEKLVNEFGVLGLTSNPSIFQRAIGESDDYDDLIAQHLDADVNTLYEHLAIRDIQDVADILKPIYDRTGGIDGYVSLEVSPLLANSTEKTVAEARRLFDAVNRPNLMIKIPGTKAGIPAIEEAIAQGINVNVTLLFSIANYEQVADAYIRGLERRLESGQDVTNIASVASFFVSRIDTVVDKILENNIRAAQGRDLDRVSSNRKLLGRAGIANAKLAYQAYRRLFEGPRFRKLRDAGAMVQRPLWASTRTKNPAYDDTLYVDNLIGKNTVNTLPPATLEAFIDHGTAEETITRRTDEAEDVMNMLKQVGVDFEQVTRQLQDDGVDKFIISYEKLLDQVEAKRAVLKTGVIGRQKVALGIYREKVERAQEQLDRDFVIGRIWSRDASVWKDHPVVMGNIMQRMGWLDLPRTIDRDRLRQFQQRVKDGGYEHVVLMGMGGSSLAPDVFARVFGSAPGFPALIVLDNTNPAQIARVRDDIDPAKTLFIVSSKSGNTLETTAFYRYFWALAGRNGDQFVAITDENTALHKIAREHSFSDVFINPADIGGRYSALSYFGMVPAAALGLDLDQLWHHADNMFEACGDLIPAHLHPGAWLGTIMGKMAEQGRDKLMLFGSESIAAFGDWAEQLIAESTGKEGKGILPIVGRYPAHPHEYGSDRVFIYLKLDGDPSNESMDAAIRRLREAGHPRVTYLLPDKYALAGEFLRWEFGTVIASHMLKVNPFDEPNVAEAKQNTDFILERYQETGEFVAAAPMMHADGVELFVNDSALRPLQELCAEHGFDSNSLTDLLAAQILGTHAGDYFALLAYAPDTTEIVNKLHDIRRRMRSLTRRAVTCGFGPRYLHSTGQLHKGGKDNGVFIQLTSNPSPDIDIPDTPYSFGVLHSAQAAGDMKALYDHSRRGIRLHATSGSVHDALDVLITALNIVEARRK